MGNRKLYEVIGYAYEAALHCPVCAAKRFANPDKAIDREGNAVTPVFLGDEFDYKPTCDDCLELLDY